MVVENYPRGGGDVATMLQQFMTGVLCRTDTAKGVTVWMRNEWGKDAASKNHLGKPSGKSGPYAAGVPLVGRNHTVEVYDPSITQ